MKTEETMLVTIGFGGWTLWAKPYDSSTSHCSGYGEDWRKYLEPGESYFVPADTPVVDCTVEGCDTAGYAIKGPMLGQRLAPNEVSELFAGRTEWDGTLASGMAEVGLDVFLAHAAYFKAQITYAGSGEAFPEPWMLPSGKADARNTAIAIGVAVDPTATIEAVMTHTIMKED